MSEQTDYTWPAKACPCGPYQRGECQEGDCEWVRDPSLVPAELRTMKPGVVEYESWFASSVTQGMEGGERG